MHFVGPIPYNDFWVVYSLGFIQSALGIIISSKCIMKKHLIQTLWRQTGHNKTVFIFHFYVELNDANRDSKENLSFFVTITWLKAELASTSINSFSFVTDAVTMNAKLQVPNKVFRLLHYFRIRPRAYQRLSEAQTCLTTWIRLRAYWIGSRTYAFSDAH
jgi:hypothetical protein